MTKVNFILTEKSITLNWNQEAHVIMRDDPHFPKIMEALKAGDYDKIPDIVSLAKQVKAYSKGDFEVKGGTVFIGSFAAPDVLSQKIIEFMDLGLPHQPLIEFAKKLQLNPSYRSVQQLYTFLEKNNHPITATGNFIAYKRIRFDYFDIHSRTFDNHPGERPNMNRNEVNEDPNVTCAKGLHVANWSYAHTSFGSNDPETDLMIEVEVSPEHVVAVPNDYNNAKMRVCEYLVLGLVSEKSTAPLHRYVQPESPEEEDEEDSDESDEDDCECDVDDPLCGGFDCQGYDEDEDEDEDEELEEDEDKKSEASDISNAYDKAWINRNDHPDHNIDLHQEINWEQIGKDVLAYRINQAKTMLSSGNKEDVLKGLNEISVFVEEVRKNIDEPKGVLPGEIAPASSDVCQSLPKRK